jgi:hypothetical protein
MTICTSNKQVVAKRGFKEQKRKKNKKLPVEFELPPLEAKGNSSSTGGGPTLSSLFRLACPIRWKLEVKT